MYCKIFDIQGGNTEPNLTDEGMNLCMEADVKPDDMLIRKFTDFQQEAAHEDVAKIRF